MGKQRLVTTQDAYSNVDKDIFQKVQRDIYLKQRRMANGKIKQALLLNNAELKKNQPVMRAITRGDISRKIQLLKWQRSRITSAVLITTPTESQRQERSYAGSAIAIYNKEINKLEAALSTMP